jgi:hypothetical protein
MLVHFATTGTTACGKGVYGGTHVSKEADERDCVAPIYPDHTTIKEFVTCEACKKSLDFKNYKED